MRGGLEQALRYDCCVQTQIAIAPRQERVNKLAVVLRAADRRAACVIRERRKALRWRFVWAVWSADDQNSGLQSGYCTSLEPTSVGNAGAGASIGAGQRSGSGAAACDQLERTGECSSQMTGCSKQKYICTNLTG